MDIWDVVYANIPNIEDATKSTHRPAIITDISLDKVKLCPITTSKKQAYIFELVIDVCTETSDHSTMGLNPNYPISYIVVDRFGEFDINVLDQDGYMGLYVFKPKWTNCLI